MSSGAGGRRSQLVSSFGGCVEAAAAGTLALAPCNPTVPSQAWEYTADHELRNNLGGLCLTAPPPPAPAPAPPSPPPPPPSYSIEYTLRLAPRSPLLNASCRSGGACEHDGINQLFAADGVAKIGSDFGSCPPLPPSYCPMSPVPSPRAPIIEVRMHLMYAMPHLLASVAVTRTRVATGWERVGGSDQGQEGGPRRRSHLSANHQSHVLGELIQICC